MSVAEPNFESGDPGDQSRYVDPLDSRRAMPEFLLFAGDAILGDDSVLPAATAPRREVVRSNVYDRFSEYILDRGFDTAAIDPLQREELAHASHEFLSKDVNEYLANRYGARGTRPVESIVPAALVTNRITRYYAVYGDSSPDSVRKQLRTKFQIGFSSVADRFKDIFPEVRAVTVIRNSLLEAGHEEASHALSELKTAYGMAIKEIRQG